MIIKAKTISVIIIVIIGAEMQTKLSKLN